MRTTDRQPSHVLRHLHVSRVSGLLHRSILRGSWGVVGTYQTLLTEGQRQERHQRIADLKDVLKEYGIGFVQVQGEWIDAVAGALLDEGSIFTPNIEEEAVKAFCDGFGQQGYAVGSGGRYHIRSRSGAIWQVGDVRDHLRLVCGRKPVSKLPERRGHQFVLDGNQWQRAQQLRDQLEGRVVDSAATVQVHWTWKYVFQCFPVAHKWVTNEGILRDSEVPRGSLLAAYLPLAPV